LHCIRIIFILFYIALAVVTVQAQNPIHSNFRQKTIAVLPLKASMLDTLSIVPSTFKILGIDSQHFRVDYANAMLYWIVPPNDSFVTVSYRVFPFKLNTVVQRMNFDSLVNFTAAPIGPRNDGRGQNDLFNFGNINAQGSFGRQIGFGNNQDVVLNSNLNIQLSGMLADSIELQAAITDNNVPIQPDGNTQQLNEFDEVYIRFKKKNWQLNIGDMDLKENRSHFLNFYKRLQGISFQTTNALSEKTQSNTLVSGSIAKGKYTKNVIQSLEGNQGPYRLSGANGETFFIVLANTERVYIDGELVQRGEDQDYVINYNTAEITFTPRRMITKDSRIQIEFEYADRNFLNTNLFAMQELDFSKKLKLRIGYFGNTDSKNSSINQVLDEKQKQFLFNIGDSVQNAFYPSATLDTLTTGKILYELVVDTLNNVVNSFYRHSVDPQKAKYNLAFTEVGFGHGNYVADNGNANGKVFVYLPPVNGAKQGNFEPVVLLVAPKKQQLFTLGADYSISKNTLLKTELAASHFDVNTFSSLHGNDNKGYAAKLNLSNAKLINEKGKLQLLTSLDYEYVQQRFQPIERLRSVEFSRDWGLPLTTERTNENIVKASAGLRNEKGNSLQYHFTNYRRSDDYNGFQNSLSQFTNWSNWSFHNQIVITNYHTALERGYFLRPTLDINKKIPWLHNWVLGGKYTLEENKSHFIKNDSLNESSFSFNTYTAYINSGEQSKNKYGISFFTRTDKYAFGKSLIRGDRSYNLNLQTQLLSNEKRQFYLNTTFRKLKVFNDSVSRQTEENTVLTRAEYQMNEWNGFLKGNVLYEIGSGQEQKRDYAYLEVPAGTGQYTWIDFNEDGIQQLNEFELAAFSDQAKFIRIFTPTNDYIKANYTTFNYNISITPKQLWGRKELEGFSKFLSRIIITSSLQIAKKSIANGKFEFNPFGSALVDSSLITMNSILANTVSFNRQSTKWGLDFSNLRTNNKSFLTYGFETRQINDWVLKYRHFLSRSFTLNINTVAGSVLLFTDGNQFENRNYDISRNNVETMLSYINGTSFRISSGYKFERKANAINYGGEQSFSNLLYLESKYNILQSASLTGKFSYNGIRFNTTKNTAQSSVGYIMLDGLLPGSNFLWNLVLTKRILKNLELNFQYDGRKPGNTKTIHTGRASLTAIF